MDAKDATDSAETVDVATDADVVTDAAMVVLVTTAVCGRSFFFAAVVVLEATDVVTDAAMTAVCGSSFFFAAAVVSAIVAAPADAVVTAVVADVAMDADANLSDGPGAKFYTSSFFLSHAYAFLIVHIYNWELSGPGIFRFRLRPSVRSGRRLYGWKTFKTDDTI